MNMLFTSTKNYSKGYNNNTNNNKNRTDMYAISYYTVNANKTLQQQQAVVREEIVKEKIMKWGEPIWFFFHTIAEKIDIHAFQSVKKNLLNIIYKVCANLPCPMCATHAIEYMNNINFNAIQTKEQLKDLLFVFHNSVNLRKNYPVFPRINLDEKYSKANTVNIIQNFFNTFQHRNSNMHMIANNMHRTNVANDIKNWFNNNIQYFDQ